jgi:hypothetical protein
MEITVTKKHLGIAQAAAIKGRGRVESCLIAQAFKATFPRKYVWVGYSTATVGRGAKQQKFDLPRKVQSLILRFDNSGGVLAPTKGELARAKKLREALPITFTATLVQED